MEVELLVKRAFLHFYILYIFANYALPKFDQFLFPPAIRFSLYAYLANMFRYKLFYLANVFSDGSFNIHFSLCFYMQLSIFSYI